MRRLLARWRSRMAKKEKETVEKKKMVRFAYTDGSKVTLGQSGVLDIRSNMPLNVPSKSGCWVKVGAACDQPIMVFETRAIKMRGLRIELTPRVFDSREEITFKLVNDGPEEQLIERNEVIARGHVLDDSDCDVL